MQLCMQCVKDSCYHSKQQADGVNVNPLQDFGQSGTLRETKWWARYPKIDHECWTDEGMMNVCVMKECVCIPYQAWRAHQGHRCCQSWQPVCGVRSEEGVEREKGNVTPSR